ncbi:MAG: hypothetical protein ACTHOG_01490 [Marmoricola sp.]
MLGDMLEAISGEVGAAIIQPGTALERVWSRIQFPNNFLETARNLGIGDSLLRALHAQHGTSATAR